MDTTAPEPRLRSEFTVERQGKTFVLYAGLLDRAHQDGLSILRTELVQKPSEENRWTAIVTAVATTKKGTFTGIGDANAENVAKHMAPHYIRLAETRAKARALRDALNIGVAAIEELDDEDAPATARTARPAQSPSDSRGNGQQRAPAQQQEATGGPKASPAQVRMIYAVAKNDWDLTDKQLDQRCMQKYGVIPVDLTKAMASELIEILKAGPQKQPA